MKHLKEKLIATVAMLVIASVMMASASYAWFTISTNPEVKDMTATVVVNENLEIAYRYSDSTPPPASAVGDTKKADTYGNLISSTTDSSVSGKTTVGNGNFNVDYGVVTKTVRPATLATKDTQLIQSLGAEATDAKEGKFYYPVYGDDGRIAYMEQLTELAVPKSNDGKSTGVGYLVARTGAGAATCDSTGKVTGGQIYGYYVDFWVRSNVEGAFQISDAAGRSSAATADTDAGSWFLVDADSGTNKTLAAAKTKLAENIGVAISFNGGTVTALTHSLDAKNNTKAIFTKDQTIGTFVAKDKHTADDSAKAGINTDIKMRVYIYLEGASMTNADASIDGGILSGEFNLQFKNANVDKSMDGQP